MFLGTRLGEANLFAELSFRHLSRLPLTSIHARIHGPAVAWRRIACLTLCLGFLWRWDLFSQSSRGYDVDMREWTLTIVASSRHVKSARLIVVELTLVAILALAFEVISANHYRVCDHLLALFGFLAILRCAGWLRGGLSVSPRLCGSRLPVGFSSPAPLVPFPDLPLPKDTRSNVGTASFKVALRLSVSRFVCRNVSTNPESATWVREIALVSAHQI